MLSKDEIQALYEEMRPATADTFSYTGEQLRSVVDALGRMDLFRGVEIEVLDSPFIGYVDEGNMKQDRCVTVQLNNAFVPRSKVKIYSIAFAPGVFKENQQDIGHGVYMLPPVTSERDFKMSRSILTKIEVERIMDARMHGDAIIEPEGQMVDKWDRSDIRVADLKANLLREFEQKLDRIFKMDLTNFADTSVSDVSRFGKVFVRVSPDSFTINTDEQATWETNTYFRIIEPVGELPF